MKRGLLSAQQLAQVRRERPDASRLDVAAVEMGLVTEEAALRALGEEMAIPFVDLEQQEIDLSLLHGFPPKLIHRHSLFPIQRNNGTLTVATSDPFDFYPLDELSATTGLTISGVTAGAASAIYTTGKTTLERSVLRNNLANHASAGNGGALYVNNPGIVPVVVLDDVDVLDNDALNAGGGIINVNGNLTIRNGSRVNGNAAPLGGGYYGVGPLTVADSASFSTQTSGHSTSTAAVSELFWLLLST